MSIKEEFLEKVKYYKGVPYHHQGRNREVGLDCAGLVVVALEDIGLPVKDLEGYARIPNAERLRAIVEYNLKIVPSLKEAEPGDIFLMRFATQPQHLAVYTGDGIVHSYSKKGYVLEQRLSDVWRKRVVGVYSIV